MRENNIIFEYMYQPPKRYTFEQKKLKVYVEKWCKGKVLNLFAGKTRLNCDEFRVDKDKEMKADYYGDALHFLKITDTRFDTVILDPPYSLRKSYEKYKGFYFGSGFTKIKRALIRVLNDNARIIILGYNSQGMSMKMGFKKIAICLICHNGDHNDTIVTIEEKVNENIQKYV